MAEKLKPSSVILKIISREKISAYCVRRASEAFDSLRHVPFKWRQVWWNIQIPAVVDSIKILKNAVAEPKWDFIVREYVTPIWNISTRKELEQALGSTLPMQWPLDNEYEFKDELIPQILLALKVLDYDEATFDRFLSIMHRCPAVGMMVCEILSDNDLLTKARRYLVEESFDKKRESLFQHLKKELYNCTELSLIHMVLSCGDHIRGIVPDQMSIDCRWMCGVGLSECDLSSIAEAASNSCLIEQMNLRDCNLTSESVAVLRDSLRKASVKIRHLDVSENEQIDVRGWSSLGDIVKNHEVEELDLTDSGLTCEKLDAFNKGSGHCKIRHLNVSMNMLMDVIGWSYLGDIVKNHEVEELLLYECGLTYEKLDALGKSSGHNKLRHLNVSWNKGIDVRGCSRLSDIVENHEVDELDLSDCGLTYEKLDALGKSSGNSKIIKLQLGLTSDIFHSREFDLLLAAAAALSLRISEVLTVDHLFPLLSEIQKPEDIKRMIEGLVMLQDFIHIHHPPPGMKIGLLRWKDLVSNLDSNWTSEEQIQRFQEEQILDARLTTDLHDSSIFVIHGKKIILEPIESRLREYETKYPQLQWKMDSEPDHIARTNVPITRATAVIGKSQDTVEVNDCSVEFEAGSFDEPQNVALREEIDPTNCPPDREAVTPILFIGAKNPLKEATVKLQTWCHFEGEEQEVEIWQRTTKDNDWKMIKRCSVGNSRLITFKVSSFFGSFIATVKDYFSTYFILPIVSYSTKDFVVALLRDSKLSRDYLKKNMEQTFGKNLRQKVCGTLKCTKSDEIDTVMKCIPEEGFEIFPKKILPHSIEDVIQKAAASYRSFTLTSELPQQPTTMIIEFRKSGEYLREDPFSLDKQLDKDDTSRGHNYNIHGDFFQGNTVHTINKGEIHSEDRGTTHIVTGQNQSPPNLHAYASPTDLCSICGKRPTSKSGAPKRSFVSKYVPTSTVAESEIPTGNSKMTVNKIDKSSAQGLLCIGGNLENMLLCHIYFVAIVGFVMLYLDVYSWVSR